MCFRLKLCGYTVIYEDLAWYVVGIMLEFYLLPVLLLYTFLCSIAEWYAHLYLQQEVSPQLMCLLSIFWCNSPPVLSRHINICSRDDCVPSSQLWTGTFAPAEQELSPPSFSPHQCSKLIRAFTGAPTSNKSFSALSHDLCHLIGCIKEIRRDIDINCCKWKRPTLETRTIWPLFSQIWQLGEREFIVMDEMISLCVP